MVDYHSVAHVPIDDLKRLIDIEKRWNKLWDTMGHVSSTMSEADIIYWRETSRMNQEKAAKWDECEDLVKKYGRVENLKELEEKAQKWDKYVESDNKERVWLDKEEYNRLIEKACRIIPPEADIQEWKEKASKYDDMIRCDYKTSDVETWILKSKKWDEAQQAGFWNNSGTHLTIPKERAQFLIKCEEFIAKMPKPSWSIGDHSRK